MASSITGSPVPYRMRQSSSRDIHACILLDAMLEYCGNRISKIDVVTSTTCCDTDIANLAHACRTCSELDGTVERCVAATTEAEIAVGLSKCSSRMSALRSLEPTQFHAFVQRDDGNSGPSAQFLIVFLSVLAVLVALVTAFIVHRLRKSRRFEKRAQRRAVLDLMEGFTPVEAPNAVSPAPWVQFQTADPVSPPPPAHSRSGEMHQVLSHPVAHKIAGGPEVPHLLLTPPPSRFDHNTPVLASPADEPVPIQRY